MAFFEFPHTRTYDSDLGWIIKRINEQQDQMDGQAVYMDELKAWMEVNEPRIEHIEEMYALFEEGQLPDEVVEALDNWLTQYGVLANAKAYTDEKTAVLRADLQAETDARTEEDDLLNARIDNIIQLTPGSTTGDAELQDIRTAADGTIYPTAGDAVRAQYNMLQFQTGTLVYTQNLQTRVMQINETAAIGNMLYFQPFAWTGDTATAFTLYGYLSGGGSEALASVNAVGKESYVICKKAYTRFEAIVTTASAPAAPARFTVLFENLAAQNNIARIAVQGKRSGTQADLHAVRVASRNVECLANKTGFYVNSSGAEVANSSLRCSDYITVPGYAQSVTIANKTTINGTDYHIAPAIVYYDASRNIIAASTNNTDDVVSEIIPAGTVYVRFNQPYNDINTQFMRFNMYVRETLTDGYIAQFHGTFTSAAQQLQTGIILKAGTTYLIERTTDVGDNRFNIFLSGYTGTYKTILSYTNYIRFTAPGNAEMIVYNASGYLGDINIKVYDNNATKFRMTKVPKVYTVDVTGSSYADYTSLTQCLLDLKNDKDEKTIYVHGGDYDIYQEYVNANVPVYTGSNWATDYWDYCVFVPDNTRIVGLGRVRLIWTPTSVQVTEPQSKTVSPLNVAGSCSIENLEIVCKNGRYCIHDDALGKPEYTGAIHEFKNLILRKQVNDANRGYAMTIGFGLDSEMTMSYENCQMFNANTERIFYGHNRSVGYANKHSGKIFLKNCILDGPGQNTIALDNLAAANQLQIRTDIDNCYISHDIWLRNGNAGAENTFDLTLLHSGTPTITIDDTGNLYPPKIYN